MKHRLPARPALTADVDEATHARRTLRLRLWAALEAAHAANGWEPPTATLDNDALVEAVTAAQQGRR